MKFKVNNLEWEMEFADEDTILLNKNENIGVQGVQTR